MGLKATRKILCVLLSFVTAAATLATITAFVLNITFASPSYFTSRLVTQQLIDECTEQLHIKYEALSAESGIPARVFETVCDDGGIELALNNAAENIFSQEDAGLYSEDRVDYFCKLCTEYLDGNAIKYNKSNIRTVGERAARIYSDTVGMHNTEAIEKYSYKYGNACVNIMSAGFLTILVCCSLFCLLYRKRNEIVFFIACAISGGGIAAMLSGLAGLAFRIGNSVVFYPEAYAAGFYSIIKHCLILMMPIGLAVTIITGLIMAAALSKIEKENNRQATRFSKVIGKII